MKRDMYYRWIVENGIKTTLNSQGRIDALTIDDPMEYVRLALNEEIQVWVNAMDDDSVR